MPPKKTSAKSSASPVQPQYARDLDLIGADAKTPAKRRESLEAALAGPWADQDVDTLERVEENGWFGWRLWRRA